MNSSAISARITGRVHGVAYRAWTRAERRGLAGRVCKKSDGSVHTLVIGPASDVAETVRALGNGPPAAYVTNVLSENAVFDREITGFRVIE